MLTDLFADMAKFTTTPAVAARPADPAPVQSTTLGDTPPAPGTEPAGPCHDCGGRHYWRADDGWRCSDCTPMPDAFTGESLTLPGGRMPPSPTTTRADLEALHPSMVAGLPLTVVLDHAALEDYPLLREWAVLVAFSTSLVATGTVDPKHPRPPATPAPAGPCPYRINLDGHAQLIWLAPGLSEAEAMERSRRHYGRERVADVGVAPPGGWPRLQDLPSGEGEAGKAGRWI